MAGPHWWSVQPPDTDTPPLSALRAYVEIVVVFGAFFAAAIAAATFSLAGHDPLNPVRGWTQAVPASMSQVATTVLCVLVPVLLASRRGSGAADLGLIRPGTVKLSTGIRIAAWAVLALIVGAVVTGDLATGGLSEGPFSYPRLTLNLFHAAQAGFLEEIIVLAFVVTTLEQARRPRPEIIAAALLLRASYHIYYGAGVAGIFIWASVFLWLYLRFRTIVPLIIVHSSWDVLIFLAHRWHFIAGIEVVAVVALFATALILWLIGRQAGNEPMPMLAAPGWYPDPGGSGTWRWYDGRTWVPEPEPYWEPNPPSATP